jgi:hypothetical protein
VSPNLFVELDGYAYHWSPEQKRHDDARRNGWSFSDAKSWCTTGLPSCTTTAGSSPNSSRLWRERRPGDEQLRQAQRSEQDLREGAERRCVEVV